MFFYADSCRRFVFSLIRSPFRGLQTWLSKTWLSKIDTVDWQNPAPVPGSGPGPSVAASRCAAAISGPGPGPGPDPGTGAGFCQSTASILDGHVLDNHVWRLLATTATKGTDY